MRPKWAAGHLFVTGRSVDRAAPLTNGLKENGVACAQFSITEEPTTELALAASREARRQNCDVVVGFGGGSVLDTGKVVAALLTNSGDLMDYLEVIGAGRPLRMRVHRISRFPPRPAPAPR